MSYWPLDTPYRPATVMEAPRLILSQLASIKVLVQVDILIVPIEGLSTSVENHQQDATSSPKMWYHGCTRNLEPFCVKMIASFLKIA